MSQQPNVLFLFTDEQRYDTLACYGNTQIQMPNLNRLAEQCVVFDQAYVTQPLCTPSRASIMTGKWPHQVDCNLLNVIMPEEHKCLPEYVPAGSYATGYHGKWHLGDEIFPQHGFEDWQSTEGGYLSGYRPHREKRIDSNYQHWAVAKGETTIDGGISRDRAARFPEAHGKPAFLGEVASNFIQRNQHQPWMLYVNFLEPHMPFFGPRDDQYDPAEIPLPENFDCPPTANHPLKYRLLREYYYKHGHSGLSLQNEAQWKKMIANYWGLCSLVDTHAGRILDTLRATGQWDNTIIVFTSDHGDMMGSHQLLAKTVMYEESVRVPMLVKMPGQKTQRHVTGPMSHIDLMPTLLEMIGQPKPDDMPGVSLLPEMTGQKSACDRDVFVVQQGRNWGGNIKALDGGLSPEEIMDAVSQPVRTIITPDGWKCCCSARGEHELYHLAVDPLEKHNLASDPAHASMLHALVQRILHWQQQVKDPFDVTPGIPAEWKIA